MAVGMQAQLNADDWGIDIWKVEVAEMIWIGAI